MGDSAAVLSGLPKDKRLQLLDRLQERLAQAAAGQNIAPRDREAGPPPLSFAQQRLWFLDQYTPGNPVYNVPLIMRLAGPLDVAALEAALGEIVRRHEVLRTTFATADEKPVQVVAPALGLTVAVTDLSHLPGAEREAEAQRLATAEARRPFDLASGPLVRAGLLRLGAEEHVLLLSMHHIVSDGWSLGVMMRELVTLYEAFRAGQPSRLPELPIQYADFAAWQRQWLRGDVLEEQLGYWKDKLGGDLAVLDLPSDRPRPAAQTFRGATLGWLFPSDLVESLKALSRQEGVTLFMTLVAGFQALLLRYAGQDDVTVGTSIANRNRAEIEPLIGFFVNMLVLRTDLSGDPTFRELLHRVREVTLGAYAHQDLPFEKIVDVLRPERDPSRTPLFQAVLTLLNAPAQEFRVPGLTVSGLDVVTETSRFDLSLTMNDTGRGLSAVAEYSTDLFDEATIARLFRHFQNLLTAAVADPGRRLSGLDVMEAAEKREMLVAWNDTRRDFMCACAHELFEAQVERTPDGVAATFEGRQLTYRELNRRANQLAHHLRRLGVGPETLVAICVERSLEMVVGVMGVLKAGGAYLPLDPTYPKDRLQFMLEDAAAPVLLTQERLLPLLPEHGARVICLDAGWDAIAGESADNPENVATPASLAYVIYTSGSTGKPKGVLIEHRAVANFIASTTSIFEVTPRDRILQFASLCFDVSVFEMFTALLSGATLVLGSRETLLSPPALTQLMKEQGVTITDLPPAMMTLLPAEEFTTERIVFVGGEAFSGDLVNRWALPGRHFYNGYGPTESTVTMTLKECLGTWTQSPPIGKPMPNHRVYILDRHLNPVPVGVPGEMYIGGTGLARGYLNRPDLTEAAFIANPFGAEPGARLYRTGDLARFLPNGDIDFLGRVDNQVKIRGFRIELGEVEAALSKHPAVKQAVVQAREDTPGAKRLVAYLLVEPGAAPSVGDLRAFLGRHLPGYMVPSAFVMLESLPLTQSGKVDLRALPVPPVDRPDLGQEFVAPRTPVEEMLAGTIFAGVLGVENVGVDDNFFELGGNSLQATQLISRIRSTFHIEIPLRVVFESPTVAGLATAIEQHQAAQNADGQQLDLLAEIESLTEEEAEKLLARERESSNG
jgi:amino acid adenylation domain-containing protein